MNQYHKIDTIYKRDPTGKQVLWGQYSRPEFEFLRDNEWVFTEKVDGTNIRVMFDAGEVRFGGKTDAASIPAHLVNRLNELFDRESMASVFDERSICLYGEGYGVKIQSGGKYKADGADFVLFDVKVGEWWLQREDVDGIAARLGLDAVPVIGRGTLADMEKMTKSGFASRWGDFPAEGIVARPATELRGRAGHRIIAKLKLRDFS